MAGVEMLTVENVKISKAGNNTVQSKILKKQNGKRSNEQQERTTVRTLKSLLALDPRGVEDLWKY